jgi:hypothetical protein
MNKLVSRQMQKSIETILKALGVYDCFTAHTHAYVKVSSAGFMPLSVEKYGSQITLAHYYEQNGDLVPDPDMEFLLSEDGWYPVAIQHATGHYSRCVHEDEAGKVLVNVRERLDQKRFADLWAGNLLAQGFARGTIVATLWD